jgi:HEPN domain-containing protein
METAGGVVYPAGVADRSADWLAQAERDLEQAVDSQRAARHEWACFAAQQAAEKAVKALHLSRGQEAWGHVVAKLLRELPEQITVPPLLVDKARVLDNFYIPSRYPNGHPEGAPAEHYGTLQSNQAIEYAGEILAFVRTEMARSAHG